MLRIFRSPEAHFEHDAELADQVYTQDALQALADAGFNAVWVRIIYRQLLKNAKYPEFGEHAHAYLANLNRVIERGEKCGVKLVTYCQEPFGLAVDDPFWETHPDMAGADYRHDFGSTEEPFYMRAFCVSSEPVREYLRESTASLARSLPGLGGIITISASEYITHCFSHYSHQRGIHLGDHRPEPLRCPRCRDRRETDVVVDVLNNMYAGLRAVSDDIPLIAWNWSWVTYEPDPQESIVSRLDPGIDLLIDFERGDLKKDATGRTIEINEYSLGFIGPSERFSKTKQAVARPGRGVYAKLQFGTTHEIATVANLPLMVNLFHKGRAVRAENLAGFMGCWNFGNELSLNTRGFNFFLSDECPDDRDAALTMLAEREFPGCSVKPVLEAWTRFGDAFEFYPFTIPFLYSSPINYALILPMHPCPLHEDKIKRSWQLDPRDDNDDPSPSFGCFTAEEIAERLTAMCPIWGEGLSAYEEGLAQAAGAKEQELATARAIDASLRSVRNYYKLYMLKRDWDDSLMPQFREIVLDELEVLEMAIPAYESDPRQGFHIEGHGYMVTPELMREKREQLRKLL